MTRPPLATVTRLVPPSVPDQVPLAAVQGALALDLRGLVAPEPAPVVDARPDDDLEAWAARFAQAVVEAATGVRPVTQLLRWTSPAVYRELHARARIVGQAATAAAAVRPRRLAPQVRSVHVSCPDEGCAEIAVHVRHGQRSRALAARLERRQGRWVCVALEIG